MKKLNISLPLIAALCAFVLALPAEARAVKKLKPGLYAAGNMEICLDKDGSWLALNRPWHGEWRAAKDVGFIYGVQQGKRISITVSDLGKIPKYTLLSWGLYTKKTGISVNRPFVALGSCKGGREATERQTESQATEVRNESLQPGWYDFGRFGVCLYKDGTWDNLGGSLYGRWGVKNGGAYIYGQQGNDISVSITIADLKAKRLTANLVFWDYTFDRDYVSTEANQRVARKFDCGAG